jgi:hypothetical protein
LTTGTRKVDQPIKDRRAPRGTLSHWRGAATDDCTRKSVDHAVRVASARLLSEGFLNKRTIKEQVSRREAADRF